MIDDTAFARFTDDTIRFERLLPGPIERVWGYLTRPELLATWFHPVAWPATVGATYAHRWDPEHPAEVLSGTLLVCEPPRVLEVSWNEAGRDDGPIRDSILRFELEPAGDRIRLTLTHRALTPREFDSIGPGWHAHLDALAASLAAAPIDPMARYHEVRPLYLARLAAT